MRNLIGALVFFAAVAMSLAGRQVWIENKQLPDGLIQANGRTEGDHVAIASKFAGRVANLLAREGDSVSEAQTIVQLDDQQLQAQLNQAKHGVGVMQAMVRGAKADAKAAAADVQAAETSLRVLKKQVPLSIETAEAELNHARALGATADSSESHKRREHERVKKLVQSAAVSVEEVEQKRLAWIVARNELTTTSAAMTTAEKRLAEAKLGIERIVAQEDAILALEAKHAKAVAHIEECQARQAAAEATFAEAQSTLDDLTITAPTGGTIVSRFVDQGEVVSAGSPLFDLVNLDRLYLQVYVPEKQIGRIRLGLPAKVYIDAFPDAPFDAAVRYIASEAEFTPKEVQTKDERVKLVYAVRLYLDANPDHRLTPGLPADAVIRWKEEAPWANPRW